MQRPAQLSLWQILLLLLSLAIVYAFNRRELKAEDVCARANLPPRMRRLLNHLDLYQSSGIKIWYNHKPHEYPIVLIDGVAQPTCVALRLPNRQVITWRSADEVWADQLLYELISPGVKISKVPPTTDEEIREVLKRHQIKLGMIFIFSSSWQPEYEGFPSMVSREISHFHHEAFHVLFQGGVQWPHIARNTPGKIRKGGLGINACYFGTAALKEIFRKEIDTLTAAYTEQNSRKSIQHVKEYLRLRSERQKLAGEVDTMTENGRHIRMPCALAEMGCEFDEGIAQYIGQTIAESFGLMTPEQVAKEIRWAVECCTMDIRTARADHFYYTGHMMLVLIRRFYKGDIEALTEEIVAPESRKSLAEWLAFVISQT